MIRTVTIPAILLSGLLFAQPNTQFPFIGISLSTQSIGYAESDIATGEEQRQTGISFHYGKQSQEWRTLFGIDYHTDSYTGAFVEVDKILLDEMFGTPKLRPYLGMTVGYMYMHDLSDAPLSSGENEDDLKTSGFYFGGNFGFLIYASDHIDLDLGYHYFSVGNLDYLDDIHGATLSIHYFF
jgi:hypothetical protein